MHTSSGFLPAIVAQAWRRSQTAGVSSDSYDRLHETYEADLGMDSRLMLAADPILTRLSDDLSGMPLSIALTDSHSRVLVRRDVSRAIGMDADRVCFAPGFTYSEFSVGANGVGTAVETGTAVYVDGPQHFHAGLRKFTCAGAPIHNPLTRRLEGVVDISCLAKDAHPLMRQLVVEARRGIESALQSTGSICQQRVLWAFLSACRRTRNPVYSLSRGIFMSNVAGAGLFDPIDESYLREVAQDLLASTAVGPVDVELPTGPTIRIRRQLVEHIGGIAGVVLEVERVAARKTGEPRLRAAPVLPGVAGRSATWTRCVSELTELAERRVNVLLIGEPGSGKASLARGVHAYRSPQAPITVIDCRASKDDVASIVSSALSASASTVVLRRVDQLPAGSRESLAAVLAESQHVTPHWFVATASQPRGCGGDSLFAHFSAAVKVPALRYHAEDVPAIITAQLDRIAPSRRTHFDTDTMQALARCQWPGNTTELVATLRHVLRCKPVGKVAVTDLPAGVFAAPRRQMTSMEVAERDLIVKALHDNDGNRVKAARQLGIARSSLYRKIQYFGIQA